MQPPTEPPPSGLDPPPSDPRDPRGCALVIAGAVIAVGSLLLFPFAWPLTVLGLIAGGALVAIGFVGAAKEGASHPETQQDPREG